LIIITGLVVGLPGARVQTDVSVSIPIGASEGQQGAPRYAPAPVTVVLGLNNTDMD